jgi:hypothetical protein
VLDAVDYPVHGVLQLTASIAQMEDLLDIAWFFSKES